MILFAFIPSHCVLFQLSGNNACSSQLIKKKS